MENEQEQKLKELESKIGKLENDNAELQKSNEELSKKILESNTEIVNVEDERKKRIEANKKKLGSIDMLHPITDLEFAKTTLELRKDILEESGEDVFLPNNNAIIKDSDKKSAQKVADILQECVDESNGDPNIFKAHLKTALAEDSPEIVAILQKRKNALAKK